MDATAEDVFAIKELWHKALSNHELNALARILEIPHYYGAISRNHIAKHPKRTQECYILNTEKSTTGNGLHWVSVIRDGGDVYFFNSYGKEPVQDVLKRYSEFDIENSNIVLQDDDDGSLYCGMISLFVLYSYWKCTRDFKKTLRNIGERGWSKCMSNKQIVAAN